MFTQQNNSLSWYGYNKIYSVLYVLMNTNKLNSMKMFLNLAVWNASLLGKTKE
jgi:hypothetical protein